MAYSLPELVLVGAAQNLVLETSPLGKQLVLCTGIAPLDLDPFPGDLYNSEATW